MKKLEAQSGVLVKPMIATVALASLAVFAGTRVAPSAPLMTVALYSIVGAVALFVALTVSAVLWLTLMQWILRNGGTDTRWFWFASDPPGLVGLRKQAREQSRRA